MKLLLSLLVLLIYSTGCVDETLTATFAPTTTGTPQVSCNIPPRILDNNFETNPNNLMDESDKSYSISGLVAPQNSKVVTVDYGCKFIFYDFRFSNQYDNSYAFGTVQIYSKASYGWVLETTMHASTAINPTESMWVAKLLAPIEAQVIKYVFINTSTAYVNFIISDIETSATYKGQ